MLLLFRFVEVSVVLEGMGMDADDEMNRNDLPRHLCAERILDYGLHCHCTFS